MQKIALALLAIALAYSKIAAISEQSLGLHAPAALAAFGIWRTVRSKPSDAKPAPLSTVSPLRG